MITFFVYNYANVPYQHLITHKNVEDIEYIDVKVLSGDEVVTIKFKDDEENFFFDSDLEDVRTSNYLDAHYTIVDETAIREWLSFRVVLSNIRIILSYVRAEAFDDSPSLIC